MFAGCLRADSETAVRLKNESSGRMHVIPLDVTSEADVRAAVHYVNDHLPHSQAGIWNLFGVD